MSNANDSVMITSHTFQICFNGKKRDWNEEAIDSVYISRHYFVFFQFSYFVFLFELIKKLQIGIYANS